MLYTKEQLRNLDVAFAVQGRADFLFRKGEDILKSAKVDRDKVHALNCIKKGIRILDEGKARFPEENFSISLSKIGMDELIKHEVQMLLMERRKRD